MYHLCIDDMFSRLDFECPDGCFLKSTSLAQCHNEMRYCVVQAPSKERVQSKVEQERRQEAKRRKEIFKERKEEGNRSVKGLFIWRRASPLTGLAR